MATRSPSMRPGVDQVVYRLAPNPGEPARPLARIASGGELSRVALAIKRVLAEADDTPDARVRRGRHAASAAAAPTRSGGACGRSPGATRSCASPTCPRSRPTPTPTSGSPSASATAGRSPRSSGSTARAGSSSSPRCSAAGRATPAALASARELLDRAEAWRAGPVGRRSAEPAGRRDDRLDRGDRGLPRLPPRRARPRRRPRSAPIAATSRDFAARARRRRRLGTLAGRRPSRYLAARTRRGRRGEPGLAPTSLRRRAAALKGFYRFAFGEGLIDVDVAAHLDLPRQTPAACPTRSTSTRSSALLEAASRRARRCATGRCWSCSTRPACGSARRSGSIARTSRSTAASCGSSARATRSGSCPIGEVALDWLDGAGSTGRGRPCSRSHHVDAGPRRAAVPRRPRPAARAPAGLGGGRRAAATRRGPRRPGQPAHAAPLVRDAPARGRRRPAGRPGVARTCEYLHDPALHAPDRRADPGRLRRAHPRA